MFFVPFIQQLGHGIAHLFYPRLCEGCSKPLLAGEQVLCLGCLPQLPLTGYHHLPDNETALRFAGRTPFAHATSFAYFTNDGLLQYLLHGLKYANKKEIGTFLGRQFGYELQPTDWWQQIDMLVPVPLHPKKEQLRGYNQSEVIAQGMGAVLGIPVVGDLLLRAKYTESQTKKTRQERIENIHKAFEINPKYTVNNKHIMLIDDTLTTGATLEACIDAIHDISCVQISIATIGIAVS